MPYGCNDNIKGVGNLSSPACSDVNVMGLFNTTLRQQRSHGQKHYHRPNVKKSSKSRSPSGSFDDLLSHLHHPLGLHYIRTILFSLPVNFLKRLRDYALDKGGTNTFSAIYRLVSIICDVALFRLFKPVRSEPLHEEKRRFLPVDFANRGIDAINICNVLHHKERECTEIDPNCFYTSGSGTQVKRTKCKNTLKFKCEQVIESDGKRTIKVKCYEYMLNWYDARKECNRTGRYIQLLNNKCENNEGFTADKLWHNTFVKERIIWNTSIVTDMERNKGYSCLAMKLTQDSKYILTAQSCDYKFKSLCQKDVSGQHIDGTSVSRTDQSTIYHSISQNEEQETEDLQNAQVSMYVGIAVAVTILLILVIVLAVCIRRRKRYKTENGPAAHNVYYSTVTGDQIQENQSNTRDGANRDQSVENLTISAKKINTYTDNDQQETNKQGAMYDQAGLQDTNEYDVSSTCKKYTPKVEEDVCYYDHNRDVDTMYDATDTKGLIQRNEMSDIYDHTREIDDAYDVSNAYRQKDKTINESVYSQSDF
ncbi:uncharacterized protein LOC134726102 [Mytilus trossulus]|uniref:uncharacterized protein LOC134726102 n=1 Tax=Mytilus trossulus TaxID=6551 RepID=UPI003007BE76